MRFRAPLAGAATAALLLLSAPPAMAAPPGNDTAAGATAVSVGFTATVDTSEATTDSDDAQLNVPCGAPATDASVWYSLTVPTDQTVIIDVSASSYSAGVLVGIGTPGALEAVACGPGAVLFTAAAGTTYYVLVIDDQGDGGGNGGTLAISFNAAPPAPTLGVTIAPTGSFDNRTGTVTLRGTYTCTDAFFAEVSGDVRQDVGRIATIRGSFFVSFSACDGSVQNWTATVTPESGRFAGGKSLAVALSFACGEFECAVGYVEQVVKLTGKKR